VAHEQLNRCLLLFCCSSAVMSFAIPIAFVRSKQLHTSARTILETTISFNFTFTLMIIFVFLFTSFCRCTLQALLRAASGPGRLTEAS